MKHSLLPLFLLAACSAESVDAPITADTAVGLSGKADGADAYAHAIGNLRFLNQFDVYVKRDFEGVCTDTEGRMAAGGSIALANYAANGVALRDVRFDGADPYGSSVFVGAWFELVHGQVGQGLGGIEASAVDISHHAVGSVRTPCDTLLRRFVSDQGEENEPALCGAQTFPAPAYERALDDLSGNLTAVFAAHDARRPAITTRADGTKEARFSPTTGTDAYYRVTSEELGYTWVLEDGARYFIEHDGEGAITFRPGTGVSGDAYALLHFPNARAIAIGDAYVGPDRTYTQRRIALSIVAADADVTFDYDILDGGLYAASVRANPASVAIDRFTSTDCRAGARGPLTGAQEAAGGQINHWPFTWSYPASYVSRVD